MGEGGLSIKEIHINSLYNLPEDFLLEGLQDIVERGYNVPEYKHLNS